MSSGDLPIYFLEDASAEMVILDRMLARLVASGYDRTVGEFPYDMSAPSAMELAQLGIALRFALDQAFAATAAPSYLEFHLNDIGLDWLEATPARGSVRFTAAAGTVIPLGTVVSTPATAASPGQTFTTDAEDVVPVGETFIDVAATATVPGIAGNVPPGSVTLLASAASGVTAVSNVLSFGNGTDRESPLAALERYNTKVRLPSAGGNRGDYVNWALSVAGVGGVNVSFPGEGSPPVPAGHVRLALVGTDRAPASNAVIEAVIDYIVRPVHIGPFEAEDALTVQNANGVSVDNTQPDDTGGSQLMVYSATAAGELRHLALHTLMTQPGVYYAIPRVKVNSIAAATDLVRFRVWNISAAALSKQSYDVTSANAEWTYRANQLSTGFTELLLPFYWNGTDQLRLEVVRLQTDTTTQLWLDAVRYRTVGADATRQDARIPGVQWLEAIPAVSVPISITATLTYRAGYDPAAVRDNVESNLAAYINGLAMRTQNDVQFAFIGTTILTSDGVADYTGLTVNGGFSNITITSEQVATVGSITLT